MQLAQSKPDRWPARVLADMNNQLDQFFLGDADMQRTVIMRMVAGRPRHGRRRTAEVGDG